VYECELDNHEERIREIESEIKGRSIDSHIISKSMILISQNSFLFF
jgi:hypothetical protein